MAMVWEPVAPWLRDLNRLMTNDGTAFVPPADVIVTEDGVQVFMDVPGLRPEDIEIDLQNDVMTVRGERPWPYGEGEGAWRRIERGFGRFERSLRVPRGLDADQIQASLSDGVLSLWIPKPESLKPRRISVDAASAGEQQPVGAGQQAGEGQPAGQQAGEGQPAGQQVGAGQPAAS
jgi:HSP20 family protein